MSVLVIGTTALDSIKTPKLENPRLLGGSASHAAVASSFFAPTRLMGVVGGDFPAKYLTLFKKHGICLQGLERVKDGKTFHWSGEYEVLTLLKRIDCLVLNDSEARQLVSDDNVVSALTKIHRMGPKYVIIKKGEHGSILSGPKGLFIAPAYPLRKVVDPTGAGDSFVGGLIGYLAAQKKGTVESNLRRAILHGSVVASFCCEGFGLNVTTRTTKAKILERVKELERLSKF